MNWIRRNKRRPRPGVSGMELAGALSVASQMALLCPPGFDELVRRELAGDARAANGASADSLRGGRP